MKTIHNNINPKIINVSRTQTSVELLAYTHSFLLRKVAPQTEDEWSNNMFIRGQQFAYNFSRLFPVAKQDSISEMLLKTPAKEGEPNNIFWMWWRIKYMQDDYVFVNNKLYDVQGNIYQAYKTMMLDDEQLEVELLNMLNENAII